jgi:hypothetical protein
MCVCPLLQSRKDGWRFFYVIETNFEEEVGQCGGAGLRDNVVMWIVG